MLTESERKTYVIRILEQIGVPADEIAAERLNQYYEMLMERNQVMNLTAITEFSEVCEKHFADSLLICGCVPMEEISSVIDVGTGAGFPGIPLKILFPTLQVTLLDSLQKRIGFLDDVIRELELSDICAVHGRAEDFGRDTMYRERYDLCVSRAVAGLSVLCELCIPFVKPGGMFVSYKSAGAGKEIDAAGNAAALLGGAPAQIRTVKLPISGQERFLVCIRKTDKTPEKYPRRAGIPAKRPL